MASKLGFHRSCLGLWFVSSLNSLSLCDRQAFKTITEHGASYAHVYVQKKSQRCAQSLVDREADETIERRRSAWLADHDTIHGMPRSKPRNGHGNGNYTVYFMVHNSGGQDVRISHRVRLQKCTITNSIYSHRQRPFR